MATPPTNNFTSSRAPIRAHRKVAAPACSGVATPGVDLGAAHRRRDKCIANARDQGDDRRQCNASRRFARRHVHAERRRSEKRVLTEKAPRGARGGQDVRERVSL